MTPELANHALQMLDKVNTQGLEAHFTMRQVVDALIAIAQNRVKIVQVSGPDAPEGGVKATQPTSATSKKA